ncbi:MAG TPA: response regulator, partial [Verrucomicrobiae bacterium]|nr:response regulator [Verrucomicrobiae bacterium]
PLQCPVKRPCRILVVDDDSDLRLLYADALARADYDVDAVENGAAAWKALHVINYDLLIIEHNLPRLTGVELVLEMRSARLALPVILVTGQLPAEALAQNPLLQLAALLPKPFYLSQLLETVRVVLQATGSIPGQLELLPVWPSQSSAASSRS